MGCFGLVTREKRIETVARAVRRISELHPNVRLLLAGQVSDPSWLEALLDRTGMTARTVVAGRLAGDEFAAAMEAADLVIHLRYPTARETSAALLRVMAQGRPVVISDIANQSEIPRKRLEGSIWWTRKATSPARSSRLSRIRRRRGPWVNAPGGSRGPPIPKRKPGNLRTAPQTPRAPLF